MAQRTECLCDGKIIGIETIYEVVDGDNINISGNIEELRKRSKKKELFCTCGCGSNVILVAGEKQLREQHFRIDPENFNSDCTYKAETKASVYSKIILKCWLDEKLKTPKLESRVPIYAVDDIESKYEFSFLIRDMKLALSYHYDKVNLIDKKLDILENNSNGIKIIYVVDDKNRVNNGQYPERLIKIQRKQGYCLFLKLENSDFNKPQIEFIDYGNAKLIAAFYIKNARKKWEEVKFEEAFLRDFSFDISGNLIVNGKKLKEKLDTAADIFYEEYIKEELRIQEEEKCLIQEQERYKDELERKRRLISSQNNGKSLIGRSAFPNIVISEEKVKSIDVTQRKENFVDENYNRWIKCKYCNEIKKEIYFGSIGEDNIRNLGICNDCYRNPELKDKFYSRLIKG